MKNSWVKVFWELPIADSSANQSFFHNNVFNRFIRLSKPRNCLCCLVYNFHFFYWVALAGKILQALLLLWKVMCVWPRKVLRFVLQKERKTWRISTNRNHYERYYTWFSDFFPSSIGGIILLIFSFSWLIVVLLVVLVFLGFGGNAVIRGSFACKYCKQREIGCPAERLFSKKKS